DIILLEAERSGERPYFQGTKAKEGCLFALASPSGGHGTRHRRAHGPRRARFADLHRAGRPLPYSAAGDFGMARKAEEASPASALASSCFCAGFEIQPLFSCPDPPLDPSFL